jgi:septum formation protein
MHQNIFILGSASKRRENILLKLGIPFEIVVPEIDEVFYEDEPRRTVKENALNKNNWCRRRYPGCRIITADTVIDFNGRCIAKPASMEEASNFLRMFSGKNHDILTAVALSEKNTDPEIHVAKSSVRFKKMSGAQIKDYLSKVNPLDKAGAYDIDQFGEIIIESFTGSYSNIMGLPEEIVEPWVKQ